MKLLEFFNRLTENNFFINPGWWYDPADGTLHVLGQKEHAEWLLGRYSDEYHLFDLPGKRIRDAILNKKLVRMVNFKKRFGGELNIQGDSIELIHEALRKYIKEVGTDFHRLVMDIGYSGTFWVEDENTIVLSDPRHIKTFIRTRKIPKGV